MVVPPITPNRQELSTITKDSRMIRAIEGLFSFVRYIWDFKLFSKIVIVKKASDLSSIDSTKTYIIDGFIDMGSLSVEPPSGGLSMAGINGGRDICGLYSTADNYTMFTSPADSYSGNIVMEGLTLYHGGTGSKLFDLDNKGNSNAIDIINVNFGSFGQSGKTVMGELSNYRQLLIKLAGFLFLNDGLTFNGTWTGIAVVDTIAISFPASKTLFKKGAGFSADNVRSNINFLSVQPSSQLFDFEPSNITSKRGFSLDRVRTSADDALPNFPASDTKALFSKVSGLSSTYVGGEWALVDPSDEVVTTISGVNTPAKASGVTTYNDLYHFTGDTDNAFVYYGDQEIKIEAIGVGAITGSNNNQVDVFFRQYKNSTETYIDGYKTAITLNSSGKSESVFFRSFFTLNYLDRVEVWLENETNGNNMTLKSQSNVRITERSS